MTIFNKDAIQKLFPTLIIWLIQIKFTYSSSNYFWKLKFMLQTSLNANKTLYLSFIKLRLHFQ